MYIFSLLNSLNFNTQNMNIKLFRAPQTKQTFDRSKQYHLIEITPRTFLAAWKVVKRLVYHF